jgi:glyoxylase-like metal-dependent hydrolase (beta-lactamase superfamily II)/ferredoxin
MADLRKKLATNVAGNFFVDSTCINCDTCRQLAPAAFRETGEYSAVYHQPEAEAELQDAWRALIACPVGSIGTVKKDKLNLQQAMASFPLHLEAGVYYNGFNSEKSFGANSYFIRHREGNWLIDSPRYVSHLVEAFEHMGGIRYIFLSHEDDVADAARYAGHFKATRIIHEEDAEAMPESEWLVRGNEPVVATSHVQFIPVPGHTAGSLALLYDQRFLFTGDHLWWDREEHGLDVPSIRVWNEEQLRNSTTRLLHHAFEWVLPGHGERMHLSPAGMKEEVQRLLRRRFKVSPQSVV